MDADWVPFGCATNEATGLSSLGMTGAAPANTCCRADLTHAQQTLVVARHLWRTWLLEWTDASLRMHEPGVEVVVYGNIVVLNS